MWSGKVVDHFCQKSEDDCIEDPLLCDPEV